MKPNKPLSILLVDDNEIDLFLHERIIRISNISQDITKIASGKEALDYLNAAARFPDLILLDIQMPEMDGFEFLDRLESLPEKKKEQLTIIMVSSSLDFGDINKAKANSLVSSFLRKPLNIDKLKEALVEEKLIKE
jgi:CheY-like chemotaxis protein